MESAVLGAVTKNVVAQVMKLVENRYHLWKDFPNDIDFIKRELLMIAGAEEDQLSEKGDPSAVKSCGIWHTTLRIAWIGSSGMLKVTGKHHLFSVDSRRSPSTPPAAVCSRERSNNSRSG